MLQKEGNIISTSLKIGEIFLARRWAIRQEMRVPWKQMIKEQYHSGTLFIYSTTIY